MTSTMGFANTWPVEKIMKFQNLAWVETEIPNICMKICYDVLIIMANGTILNSLNLNKKLKGYFKETTLIFAFEEHGALQKTKIKLDSSIDDMEPIINNINIYTTMHDLNESDKGSIALVGMNNFQKLMKEMEKQMKNFDCDANLPVGFPMNDFLKLCFLDPSFPPLVEKMEKLIQQSIN